MHICILGWANHVILRRWASYFVEQGHQVSIISEEDAAPLAGARIIPLRYPKSYYKKIAEVFYHAQRLKPDIVNAHFLTSFGYLGRCAFRRPLVQTLWGSDINNYPYADPDVNVRLLSSLKHCDMVICQTDDMSKKVVSLGIPVEKIYKAPMGVNLDKFKKGSGSQELEKRLNLSNFDYTVFSPRQFMPIYNIDTIIRSIPEVLDKFPRTVYLFQNYRGGLKAELQDLAESLGVTANTRFLEAVAYNAMPDIYNLADVVVSVPSNDGAPSSVFEAMASGLPVIVSDLPALRELFGGTARFVPIKDSQALSGAIIDILGNDEERRRVGKINREFVEGNADHYKIMRGVEERFIELIGLQRSTKKVL